MYNGVLYYSALVELMDVFISSLGLSFPETVFVLTKEHNLSEEQQDLMVKSWGASHGLLADLEALDRELS